MSGPSATNQPDTERDRLGEYRDLLEAWSQWWDHLGRQHYRHPGIPPLTATREALFCTACAGVGPYEAGTGPDRCQVCSRRLP